MPFAQSLILLLFLKPVHEKLAVDRDLLLSKDLSELLLAKEAFLGFIGNDKRRIYMQFDSIWKDHEQYNLYHIKGHSTVKGNRCDFKGMLIIESIETDQNIPLGLDERKPSSNIQASGKIKGHYLFSENPKQKHVGLFSGNFWCTWLLTKDASLSSNELQSHGDNYRDHQYQGIWRPYGESDSRVCNWGTYRIPNCGDLDIGAAEFSPNPKYHAQGW